jgi:hypothetical protein
MLTRLRRARARKERSETFVLLEDEAKYVMISETSSKQLCNVFMRKINQNYVNATNEYLWVSFLFLPICAPVPFMS